MPDSKLIATVDDVPVNGPLRGAKLTLRYGDSQKDGQWYDLRIEIAGRMVPFATALKVLTCPEVGK